MHCPLGLVGTPCLGLDKRDNCKVFMIEGVLRRSSTGTCNFKNLRAPTIGIYAKRGNKKINPIKASKKEKKS